MRLLWHHCHVWTYCWGLFSRCIQVLTVRRVTSGVCTCVSSLPLCRLYWKKNIYDVTTKECVHGPLCVCAFELSSSQFSPWKQQMDELKWQWQILEPEWSSLALIHEHHDGEGDEEEDDGCPLPGVWVFSSLFFSILSYFSSHCQYFSRYVCEWDVSQSNLMWIGQWGVSPADMTWPSSTGTVSAKVIKSCALS